MITRAMAPERNLLSLSQRVHSAKKLENGLVTSLTETLKYNHPDQDQYIETFHLSQVFIVMSTPRMSMFADTSPIYTLAMYERRQFGL